LSRPIIDQKSVSSSELLEDLNQASASSLSSNSKILEEF